jgi:hypothetical protein
MELFRALGVLSERPAPGTEVVARALGLGGAASAVEHTQLFQLELTPYASVYLGDEGMLGGEARDRVAGFWRALGLVPPAEPDHLAALLGLYATLAERETPGEARRALLWEHLLSWLPPYLEKAEQIGAPVYRAWARLLREGLLAEAERFPAGGLLPLQLRLAAPVSDPRADGLEALLASLLAPVRSGLVLVRSDLARAAYALGLGLRHGERRFVLRALLAQDAPGTLRWLAGEAERWTERHRRLTDELAPVPDFWAVRAERTGRLLTDLVATTEMEVAHV